MTLKPIPKHPITHQYHSLIQGYVVICLFVTVPTHTHSVPTCGRAHLYTAAVTCGSLCAAPSACWRGPAVGTGGFSVRCAADFPGLRLSTPWRMLTPASQPARTEHKEKSVQ